MNMQSKWKKYKTKISDIELKYLKKNELFKNIEIQIF